MARSIFRIFASADAWVSHTGGVLVSSNGRGMQYRGAKKYTVPKALEFVRVSLTAQGRAYREESTPDGYITITADL